MARGAITDREIRLLLTVFENEEKIAKLEADLAQKGSDEKDQARAAGFLEGVSSMRELFENTINGGD